MALLTAAEARDYLPAVQGTGEDTLLGLLIGRVGVAIARLCGYPPASVGAAPTVESASYTLYTPQIGVSEDGRRLYLPVRPITAVVSVYDDPNEEYGADTLVSSSDYAIDGDAGEIRLKAQATHGAFSSSVYAVRVICTAGFVTIPADLKHAAGLTVQHAMSQRQGTQRQIGGGGVTTTPQNLAIPAEAAELLMPYRLARGWAA